MFTPFTVRSEYKGEIHGEAALKCGTQDYLQEGVYRLQKGVIYHINWKLQRGYFGKISRKKDSKQSQEGGAHPLHPSLKSAAEFSRRIN